MLRAASGADTEGSVVALVFVTIENDPREKDRYVQKKFSSDIGTMKITRT